MKYTIELTEKQANQLNDIMLGINASWGYASAPKLKMNTPLLMKESPAYSKGFEDGKKWAIDENFKDHLEYYDKGLEEGYKGYKYLNEWFVDNCFFEDFEGEGTLFPEYKRRQANACCLEDIITDVGFAEMLKRVKAWEEKKKAEQEIKVGDEVVYSPNDTKFYVIAESLERYKGIYYSEYNKYFPILICDFEKDKCKKTGKHIDELEQLLDKLRGKEE